MKESMEIGNAKRYTERCVYRENIGKSKIF